MAQALLRNAAYVHGSSCTSEASCAVSVLDTRAPPYIETLPAVLAGCTLLFSWFRAAVPRWARAFVEEPREERDDVPTRDAAGFPLALWVISLLGLGCHVSSMVLSALWPCTAWTVAATFITARRPRTASFSLLTIFTSIFMTQLFLLINGLARVGLDHVSACLALVAAVLILNMPMRDPICARRGVSVPFTPPTAELRSPEDDLTLWQFMSVSWMKPLIALGNRRQLNDEDVWSLGYEFQHRLLHDRFRELKGSVLGRLVQANWLDLVIVTLLGMFELVTNFSAPVLLQKVLQSIEDPETPRRAAVSYTLLALVMRLLASQSGVFSLWYGRRAYERSRGELITMLYEKTLSRKVVSVSSKAVHEVGLDAMGNDNVVTKCQERSTIGKICEYLTSSFRWLGGGSKCSKVDRSKELASMGKIMNLMRFDAYEVAQRFWEVSIITSIPLSLVVSVILTWRLLGWPCLIGIMAVLLAQAINALLARTLLNRERERKSATDEKLHKISQLVDAIRHLRYYGWQDVWLQHIMKARQYELRLKIVTSMWSIAISVTNSLASGLFPVVVFWGYTVLAGKSLTVDVAFPALQLFSMLETSLRDLPNLITALLNAKVSLVRLDTFMNEPDRDESNLPRSVKIEMKQASFAWPGSTDHVLSDLSLSFEPGLTVICGEVGSGKSALLQALLGELDQTGGEYHRTNEMVGYCGQTPWLQSMSIRENILFSAPYEEARYQEVLEVCALIPDMAQFQYGDQEMIGENGVGLSGGQKARVSLARAVYSHASLLLLDDPLSALDHQTAAFVARKCLAGPLLRGRTVILVTHRTELCLSIAKQAIVLSNGHASLVDPDMISVEDLHRVHSTDSAKEPEKIEDRHVVAAPEIFMEDEFRAHGGVQAKVYWDYIKAGKLRWWFLLILILALYRVIEVGETWFLKQWGEAYEGPVERAFRDPFGDFPSPETNIRPWLVGFFLLATAQSLAYLLSQGAMLVIIYQAGKALFARVMRKVTHATFRFYDITPVGRLMNRLTSDINTVDGNISNQFQDVVTLSITWISSIIVIGSVTPLFLFFALGLSIAFIFIFLHFLPTSQSLRRLEMVSLTPLISNFGALTDGLTTIRAYGVSSRFQDRVISVTDAFQKMDHFYWSLQAWLMYRFDTLSAISTCLLTLLALYTGVSAGLTAFVLTASTKFVTATHSLCKKYGQLQMDFVSVERVVELLHLPQESPGKVTPPAYWPRYGASIVFDDVSLRYAPHLDPALAHVSLTIPGGRTTALTGRTGSGKSTLALSLLGTITPCTGRILIDGIDIAMVNRQCLRERITFLAQDPVLFPGSMRANLDPLGVYSVEECRAVLDKVCDDGEDYSRSSSQMNKFKWSLETCISRNGENLSHGQRQLVGLARALLRRSAVVVMDEATASVDPHTAARVLHVLRRELVGCTVLVVAHRFEAVAGADVAVELVRGRLRDPDPDHVDTFVD